MAVGNGESQPERRLTSTHLRLQRPPAENVYSTELLLSALADSLRKFDPRIQVRNPVMFVVWLGAIVTAALTIEPSLFGPTDASKSYNALLTAILLVTVWFANLSEAIAEGRGKAKAAALRQTRTELTAKRMRMPGGGMFSSALTLRGGTVEKIPAMDLRKGDLVRVDRDEVIPADGEVMDGTAYVDESSITGEAAPVLKEPHTDIFSSVTAGTRVISDQLLVSVSANPGESFLDRMIHLVEGAKRQKTPNEIALTVLLSILTLIFVIVAAAMAPVARYLHAQINVADLIALLVALIPTTIGALLSAIGIAGIDRTARFNILAMSGKAVEAAGDVHCILLDKTGTITIGNRQATDFVPLREVPAISLVQTAYLASLFDSTPEGRTIVSSAERLGARPQADIDHAHRFDFSSHTRMSGVDLPDGRMIRKGAVDAVLAHVREKFNAAEPADLNAATALIASRGATPLAVALDGQILGLVALSDVLKPGIHERIAQLRKIGIRSVMVTGDNPLTARAVAQEAGVDDFIAEAKPEEKLRIIREEQSQGRLVAMTGDGTNDAPALAQADVGLAMHSGTMAAKEAANLIDLDSDPTKLIDLIALGKQMLITRGALTTFSIANDVAKYFAILPGMFILALPGLSALNVMHLATPQTAVLSALIFNALIIPSLIPLALRGVRFRALNAEVTFYRNLIVYGLGGLIVPFVGIKVIDLLLSVSK
ncbi:MAG: potassium-transporting ATPase subunit KdpB [Deltaproteobacteria bacterium]|nr:potassium-transporting ATPase subunit KdpB [Deltaproteobacteria bacterium]